MSASSVKYANFRRSAQNSVAQITFKPTPATSLSESRAKMVPQLSPFDQQMLIQQAAQDGRTEADVYLVLKGVNPGKFGRAAVETDSAPRIMVDSIIGLDKLLCTVEFALPLHVIHEPLWRAVIPDFSAWLLTSGRYPSYNDDTKKCFPQNQSTSSGMKKVSEIDKLELYFGYFMGTLDAYWHSKTSTDDLKHSKHLWCIVHTLRSILSSKSSPSPTKTDFSFEQFTEIVKNRDLSHTHAVAFKTMMTVCSPSDFYDFTLKAMSEAPEIVHKSRFPNLDYLLLGLITLPHSQQLDYNAILRTILERTIKYSENKNMRNFVNRTELIEFIQIHVGGRIELNILWWAFFINVLQDLLLGTVHIHPQNFREILSKIRTEMKQFSGGLSGLCLLISPTCTMQDDDLAEFILAAAESEASDKKYSTLPLSMIQNGKTPLLDKILSDNITRLQKEEADSQTLIAALAQTKLDNSNDSKQSEVNISEPWDSFRVNRWKHAGDPSTVHALIRLVVALASGGTRVEALTHVINKASVNKLMGYRRLRTLASRFAPEASIVKGKFHSPVCDISVGTKSTTKKLIYDLVNSQNGRGASSIDALAQMKKTDGDDLVDTTSATFVRFEIARTITTDYLLRMKAMAGELKFCCHICYKESKGVPIVMHKDSRHAVCVECAPKLEICPFCRLDK